jgi:nitrite reductase (NADH) small subunit
MTAETADRSTQWISVCALDDILPDTGVCALIDDRQIAVVRLGDGRVFAVDNFDPFSKAFVISRGIVGCALGRPKIASPIYKQTFDLETGACFEHPHIRLPTYPCRVVHGVVHVGRL